MRILEQQIGRNTGTVMNELVQLRIENEIYGNSSENMGVKDWYSHNKVNKKFEWNQDPIF